MENWRVLNDGNQYRQGGVIEGGRMEVRVVRCHVSLVTNVAGDEEIAYIWNLINLFPFCPLFVFYKLFYTIFYSFYRFFICNFYNFYNILLRLVSLGCSRCAINKRGIEREKYG
jgi:hypothetical protein